MLNYCSIWFSHEQSVVWNGSGDAVAPNFDRLCHGENLPFRGFQEEMDFPELY